MTLTPVVLILTVALTPFSDAATTYNLALLQETMEIIAEDVAMFVTSKINGGDNTADDGDTVYDTADEQPGGIDEDEDDEGGDEVGPPGGNATLATETEAKEKEDTEQMTEDGSKQEGEAGEKRDGIEKATLPQPKSAGKKKYVAEIKESKESSAKANDDIEAVKVKTIPNETDNEDNVEEDTEGATGNEEEPDMAETLASMAINVAAQKFKQQLGKLNIQL